MIKFTIEKTVPMSFKNEDQIRIFGTIEVRGIIEKKFELYGNEYDGWDLHIDGRLIHRMPMFKWEQKEAPFKWMIGFIDA